MDDFNTDVSAYFHDCLCAFACVAVIVVCVGLLVSVFN